VRRLDSLSANTCKLSNSAPIEAVSAGRVRSKRRAGFDDSGAAVEAENADLGFIDNNNLGDSLVAIRGEANDVNRMFDINLPRLVEVFRAPGRIAITHLVMPPSGLVLPRDARGDN
jgi:hypothetical protein